MPAAAALAVLLPLAAFAQTTEPVAAQRPPLPGSLAPPQKATDSDLFLTQLAGLVNRGKVNVDIDLQAGRVAVGPAWTVEVTGNATATLVAEADEGRVRKLDVAIGGGRLLIEGKGLRPDLSIEGLHFEEGKGITEARFRGRGIWRPIVAVARTLARPALRKLDIPTNIASILRGEILSSKTSSSDSGEFLTLVREVHIHNTEFVAFAGYPLALDSTLELRTAAHPTLGVPLRATVDRGTFRPARDGKPARFEADGRLSGEIENGSVAFTGSRCTFSHGALEDGAFRVASGNDGQPETSFSAAALTLDLTSGQFRWPGGPKIGVEAPSRFAVRKLQVRPDGSYSGTVDAALFGKVGALERAGTSIAANDIEMHTEGATIADGRATGDLKLAFRYSIDQTLVINYPVEQVGIKRVPVQFQGSFAADLHFENAGSGDEGVVSGQYQFTVPWAPVEHAAFEVLRARWRQDVTPVMQGVEFVIEPRRFGPCGRGCFLLDLVVTAEKPAKTGYLFQQICDTEEKADLVVDGPGRSLVLRNVRVEPHCRGVIGAIANLITPFLTKSYTDITLLAMPANLPFTIESVDSGADSINIGGKIAWAMR
jgi:hypothetical protein